MATNQVCGCGMEVAPQGMAGHLTGRKHKEALAAKLGGTTTSSSGAGTDVSVDTRMDIDLANAIKRPKQTGRDLQLIAKNVRMVFADRRWPSEEHPGTVLDFLREQGIPTVAQRQVAREAAAKAAAEAATK